MPDEAATRVRHSLTYSPFAFKSEIRNPKSEGKLPHFKQIIVRERTHSVAIEKIRKRNGLVVNFDPDKIATAIRKAMVAVRGRVDAVTLTELTGGVVAKIPERFGESIPDVEGVQDLVERTLMESGYYDVARAYILYRERRREIREAQKRTVLQRIEQRALHVVKRDGRSEPFDEKKLKAFFLRAIDGYEGVVEVTNLLQRCEEGVYDGISTAEIGTLAVLTARAFIEQDPAYDTITSRLFQAGLYREAFGAKFAADEFDHAYQQTFIRNIKLGVKLGRLTPDLLEFDLDYLAMHLEPERDSLLGYRGLQTLYDRYFLCEKDTERHLETPQAFWMRVAMGLALKESLLPTPREAYPSLEGISTPFPSDSHTGRPTLPASPQWEGCPKDGVGLGMENNPKSAWAITFYRLLSSLRFVCSTPTLFHAGTPRPQLSSCYITTVDDSLEHIFKCLGDNAQLSKWSGGLGNDWTNVRAMGASIKSTGVESQGVIPFLKIANDTTAAINRSGKRRGATCAYLENWHLDIDDFLDLRRNTGDERRRTHDMNIAVWVSDLFMKRVMADEMWTLFSPDETPDLHHLYGKAFEGAYEGYEAEADSGEIRLHRRVRAQDLWRKMITRLYETGHPWITFKDPCNVRSPQDHVGVIHSSNLCTEITLNTSKDETAVCNLGSVNLAQHIVNGQLDAERLKETVTVAMRMLDNVVDINFYPTIEAKQSNCKHRPVGLGVMGFQDALYLMDINFDSEAAALFADESMELVAYAATLASAHLAKERGPYDTYEGSKWARGYLSVDTLDLLAEERGMEIPIPRAGKLDWTPVREAIKRYGMRNSNCLAIAPTATISNIAGCFPSIEPIYKNLYVKSNMSGEFTVLNRYLIEDLKSRGLWNNVMLEELKRNDGCVQDMPAIPIDLQAKYKTAFVIEP